MSDDSRNDALHRATFGTFRLKIRARVTRVIASQIYKIVTGMGDS